MISSIVVALFFDSEVSSPAAGLAVIAVNTIAKVGSSGAFPVAVVLAGVLPLKLSLRKGRRFNSFRPGKSLSPYRLGQPRE